MYVVHIIVLFLERLKFRKVRNSVNRATFIIPRPHLGVGVENGGTKVKRKQSLLKIYTMLGYLPYSSSLIISINSHNHLK